MPFSKTMNGKLSYNSGNSSNTTSNQTNPKTQKHAETCKVNFLTQIDSAQIHETHEKPCGTPPQPQSQHRLENRKKFLVNPHICENLSVTGLQPLPEELTYRQPQISKMQDLTTSSRPDKTTPVSPSVPEQPLGTTKKQDNAHIPTSVACPCQPALCPWFSAH